MAEREVEGRAQNRIIEKVENAFPAGGCHTHGEASVFVELNDVGLALSVTVRTRCGLFDFE